MLLSSSQTKALDYTLIIVMALFLLILLTSCQHTVPDVAVCYELSPTRGTCVTTISGREFEVDEQKTWPLDDAWKGKTWWDVRHLMLLVPGEVSWVPMRAFIVKICKDKNTCQQEVKNWERTVEKIDAKPVP